MKKCFLIFFALLIGLLSSCASYMEWYYSTLPGGKAQHDAMMRDINSNNSTSSRGINYNLTYCEWPDGCLTYENRGHYDVNFSHRNDNSYVRNLINDFNSYVKQYNAVQYIQGRQYNKGTYVYYIDKSTNYSPGVMGVDPGGTYFIYVCSIWQI